eukprot:8139005-Ditylum_brightwellii.AAC.1
MELLLGDPANSQETAGKYNQCPNCMYQPLLDQSLYQKGIKDLMLQLFVHDEQRIQAQWTLDVFVDAIKFSRTRLQSCIMST